MSCEVGGCAGPFCCSCRAARSVSGRAAFSFQEVTVEWIGWAIVLGTIAALAAYRYAFGTWPLRLDL
jgi:hypothetical protein